jgi:Lrp/AsnC family transcriptional regulator, leucine-responsive regulatory protein
MIYRRQRSHNPVKTKENGAPNQRSKALIADPKNLDMLRALQADPRLPISELARRIGMSAPAVRERLQRLEDSGVITGYRLDIDPKALGLPVMAIVRLRPLPGQLQRIVELVRDTANVSECHRVTGEDCFIIKMHLDAIESLDRVLDRFLAHATTTTSIVQSSPVPLRSLPLPG